MDSFILYNAEFDLPTELEVPAIEPKEIANKSSVQIQEISEDNETSDTQEKSEESKKLDLIVKKVPGTLDTNYEHEIILHL